MAKDLTLASIDQMKIIVITPVKNEGWILNAFIQCTLKFADHIIIADQQSTDNSLAIASSYGNVTVVPNEDSSYDESSRQQLLLKVARKLFPVKKIIFALDADEIITLASVRKTCAWERIKKLSAGSTVFFEKPEILAGYQSCVRWRNSYFPIAYVDDGKIHVARKIHSQRIPSGDKLKFYYEHDIKFMHFSHTRINAISSKIRYYSIQENINQTKPFYLRRYLYSSFYKVDKYYPPENIEQLPMEWLNDWKEYEIVLTDFSDPQITWREYEILALFEKYGAERFLNDDIWQFDWESLRKYAMKNGFANLEHRIEGPGNVRKNLLNFIDRLYILSKQIKGKLNR